MRAVVFTLGCKVNKYESDYIAQELENRGYSVSETLTEADIYIINTCAVTQEAEKKSRQSIARCKKFNANAKIFILGCASQKNAVSFERENVVYIGGTGNKYEVLNHINDIDLTINADGPSEQYENCLLQKPSRTRAYIKIQDGCNNFCSYCIIPYLRGRSCSRRIDDIIKEATILSKKTNEIVLTGINTMDFGRNNNETLEELIHALKDINVRFRLGSFYAEGLSKQLLDELFSMKNFCPHFHLSLQSGDKDVLRDMNRHYTPEIYRKKIDLIRSYDKNASITTDIIIGYPTETEERFFNTIDFINSVSFSDIHIFPFSAREGTRAYKLQPISPEEMSKRKEIITNVKKELREKYLQQNIMIPQEVLIEEKEGSFYCGYSKNYIKIYTKEKGNIITITPQELFKEGLK